MCVCVFVSARAYICIYIEEREGGGAGSREGGSEGEEGRDRERGG